MNAAQDLLFTPAVGTVPPTPLPVCRWCYREPEILIYETTGYTPYCLPCLMTYGTEDARSLLCLPSHFCGSA